MKAADRPFEETFALLAHEGELRWFAKRTDGLKLGGVARSPERLAQLRRTSENGADVYVQLNPSVGFKGQRAGARDITHFRGFLLDLDPAPQAASASPLVPEHWWPEMASAVDQLAELLGGEVNPWLVNSGRGLQAWILGMPFSPPGEWRPLVRRAVSAMVKRLELAPGVIADPMVCDVSRVVRLPGTVNQKTGRTAELLHLGVPTRRLFERLAAVDPGEEEVEPSEALPGSKDSYTQVWVRLTATAQRFITTGWTYPGRHSALWHTAELLHREGLSVAAAERALWLGARACRPQALSRSDVRYALERGGFTREELKKVVDDVRGAQ